MRPARNFLVIGSSRPIVIQVLLALHTFTEANCIVICHNGMRFIRLSNLVSECRHFDLRGTNDDMVVECINSFTSTFPDLTILPADCDGARIVARLRSRIAADIVPSPDCAALDRFNDKWEFYLFCKRNGLNVPLSRFLQSKHQLDFGAVAGELGTPFVVKPLSMESSTGVCLLGSDSDCRRLILDDPNYQYAPLIAQRFVKGRDVGLDLMSRNGQVLAVAIQQRDHPQHEAASIRFVYNAYLKKVAHVIASEGRYEGVMNIDARIEEGTDEVFLFESNPRFWRSLSASVWGGLNFAAASIEDTRPVPQEMYYGRADTFYHPLFRPSLWPHALFDRQGHRGRLARLMMRDMCTLASQIKTVLKGNANSGMRH